MLEETHAIVQSVVGVGSIIEGQVPRDEYLRAQICSTKLQTTRSGRRQNHGIQGFKDCIDANMFEFDSRFYKFCARLG